MKRIIALCLTTLFISALQAQKMDSLALTKAFDFWVGEWDATWDKPDGTKGKGTNSITKTLDEKVIHENFEIPATGFKGTSISVFNPRTKTWHQAWADNSGGYFDFIGIFNGDKKIFQTKPVKKGDQTLVSRMVFYDFKADSFSWDWEGSNDGGETWSLNWRISYTRK